MHCFVSYSSDEGGSNVIIKQMVFSTEGRDDVVLDLTGELVCWLWVLLVQPTS